MEEKWVSRRAGTILSVLMTIYMCLWNFICPESAIEYWFLPLPIWICFCIFVYIIGRLIKKIVRFL